VVSGRKIKATADDRIFAAVNYLLLSLVTIIMLIPFIHELSISFSSSTAVNAGKVLLLPVSPTASAWSFVLTNKAMLDSLRVTVIITVLGVFAALAGSVLFAYPLSKSAFRLAKPVMVIIVFTMVFRHPVIPYFLTLRAVGLIDNLWVLVIPGMINPFHIVIMRSFFKGIPLEMEESAKLDGANSLQILFLIVLPLSKALLATIALFHAVIQWNMFFHALLFIRKAELFPLQIKLREMIASAGAMVELGFFSGRMVEYSSETAKAAAVMFATLPILVVYPFLQKHFVKGALLGSVKG
jgi:putative aldouronate transport system permease protein